MKNFSYLLIIILFISSLISSSNSRDSRAEIESLKDELSSYEDALSQANSNIEDAQYYEWSSYEEMGDALDGLETVEP